MPVIDETKVFANVTSTHNSDLIFYVLEPLVNDESFYNEDLNNATYVTARGELIEFSSEQFRNRDEKRPYFQNGFPTGYHNGRENFYPMRLKPGETKNSLAMVKEDLDRMVTAGLVTYTAVETRDTFKVKAAETGFSVHGELLAKGKTRFVEASNEVLAQIAAGKLDAEPTISNVSPATGDALGGETVTITGTNFNKNTIVKFGGSEATNVVINSVTELECDTPPGGAGQVDVTVENTLGSDTLTNGFEYLP